MPENLVFNLLIILGTGLLAGVISKRLNIPMVIGYLVAGALIGPGGFKIFVREAEEEASKSAVVQTAENAAATEEFAAPDPNPRRDGFAERDSR